MGFLDFLMREKTPTCHNSSLSELLPKLFHYKLDTVTVTTSRLCPVCSTYQHRVFSVFGRDSRFPCIPDFLSQDHCPRCNHKIFFLLFFPDVETNLQERIRFSNQSYTDHRTNEEKAIWEKQENERLLSEAIQSDYIWITENLPNMAPKSLGGFKRMRNSKSTNYLKIVKAANEMGRKLV